MESRVCSNCGTLVLLGDKFCLRCGKPVKMTAPSEAVSYPANNQSVSPDYNADEQSLTAPSGGQTDSWDTGINFGNFHYEQPEQEHLAGSGQIFVQPSAEQQNTVYPEQQLYDQQSVYPNQQPYDQQPVYPNQQSYDQQPVYPNQQPYDQQPVYPNQQSYDQQSVYPNQQPYDQQPVNLNQQLYDQQPVYPNQQLYSQQAYPDQQGYDHEQYGRQPVQPDVSSMQSEISSPEPQVGFVSSGEEAMQDGFRRFLSSDQESWNRWVQSNMASSENLEGGGRKAKRSKIWPFGR